ncbi:MAG: hypothetical protein LBC72_03340 [Spirochaetaceae bacterium]|jgi:hypothetical protein|nr:hypothetical protein [Spirochaetaceae bacterium]
MKKTTLLFLFAGVLFLGTFIACDTPVARKAPGTEPDPEPLPGLDIEPEEPLFYPTEEGGIQITVKLTVGGDSRNASVEKGRIIIGTYGFTSGGINSDTVWMKKTLAPPASPDDVEFLPFAAAEEFVPFTDTIYGSWGYTAIRFIEGAANFGQIDTNGATTIHIMKKNILLSGDWANMAGSTSAFQGWFNGGGYTLKNLRMKTSDQYAGLFAKVQGSTREGGTRIENLRITLANTSGASALKPSTSEFYASPVVGEIIGTGTTVIRRVAVSMDKDKSIAVGIGSGGNDRIVSFGGIVANVATSAGALTHIEECAVNVRVEGDTGFDKASRDASHTPRLVVGGIAGTINAEGRVIIRNNYSIGRALLTGVAPLDASQAAKNYPKFGGGIVGLFAKGPGNANTPSAVYNNYAHFDIEITGGILHETGAGANFFRAAGGIVGAKSETNDSYLSVYGNSVMTPSLITNYKSGSGANEIIYAKRIVVLNRSFSADKVINKASSSSQAVNNTVWGGVKAEYVANEDKKDVVIPDPPTVLDGTTVTDAGVFLNTLNYINADWDFDSVWIMGKDIDVVYDMAELTSLQTDQQQHYGAYPYPLLRWLCGVIPVTQGLFKPISYLTYGADGYDKYGYDKQGYHKDPPNLNRDGYDKYGVYGGYLTGAEYYMYEEMSDLRQNCTMLPPGFSWSSPQYYKQTATVTTGDWSVKGSDLSDVPVPKDHGQAENEPPVAAAQGRPCPWVDTNNDGFHDTLGFGKDGFNSNGKNIYGYNRNGTHTDGYTNGGVFNGQSVADGLDVFGLPCPWIDANDDGNNDITGKEQSFYGY